MAFGKAASRIFNGFAGVSRDFASEIENEILRLNLKYFMKKYNGDFIYYVSLYCFI